MACKPQLGDSYCRGKTWTNRQRNDMSASDACCGQKDTRARRVGLCGYLEECLMRRCLREGALSTWEKNFGLFPPEAQRGDQGCMARLSVNLEGLF